MSGADHGGWKAYEYYPSKAAAVVFIILFVVVSLLHSYQLARTRTWFFIPMAIGAWCEYPSGWNYSPD